MAKKKIAVRSAYNYDTDAASEETGIVFRDKTRTQQNMKDEADINVIVRRFGVTGQLPTVPNPPTFADFEGIFDFQDAQNLLRRASESFMALPANVRKRFNHDPGEFVEFCSDEKNIDEMRKLGLANLPPAEPKPAPAPANPPAGD